MGIRQDQLGTGEVVVLNVRTHAKALFWPLVALLLIGALLGLAVFFRPRSWDPWGLFAAMVVAVILLTRLVFLPYLRWLSSTYTVTDRRIITRKGLLNRSGHDLPLRRINNVNYERSLLDRLLGCGTLVLETAAGEPVVLPDVPKVEKVHVTINDLLFGGGGPSLENGDPAHIDD